jgi:glycosyltransferase involved in cell wall biosynthesis
MLRTFQLQRQRQSLLAAYASVLTLSQHMRREYVANGASPAAVHVLPYFAPDAGSPPRRSSDESRGRRLIYVGRMEAAKGGFLLIRSLERVARELDVPVQVTFVGDGRERMAWQTAANEVHRRNETITSSFTGWLPHDRVRHALASADLLVVPSTWPEPFGLVGPEAASVGVPAVAFDVGGICEWLIDGVTGHLAHAAPPSADSLAAAIVASLGDPDHHRRLSQQARARARSRPIGAHVRSLIDHLAAACDTQPAMIG